MRGRYAAGVLFSALAAAYIIFPATTTQAALAPRPGAASEEAEKGEAREPRSWLVRFFMKQAVSRYVGRLDLTKEQKARVNEIIAEERRVMDPLIDQLLEIEMGQLRPPALASFDEKRAREVAERQARIIADLLVAKERVKSKIYGLLTPVQRAKADRLIEEIDREARVWLAEARRLKL